MKFAKMPLIRYFMMNNIVLNLGRSSNPQRPLLNQAKSGSNRVGISRREMLGGLFSGLATVAAPQVLLAQNTNTQVKNERELSEEELKPKPGPLATRLGYDGFINDPKKRESEFSFIGRDIRMRILNSISIQDWDERTKTANPTKGTLGFVDDLENLATCELGGNPDHAPVADWPIEKNIEKSGYSHTLKAIEKFATEIKSARLASLIAGATAIRIPCRLYADGSPTQLPLILERSNLLLNVLGYNDKDRSLEGKRLIEDTILKAFYGEKWANKLFEIFPVVNPNDSSNPDLFKYEYHKGGRAFMNLVYILPKK